MGIVAQRSFASGEIAPGLYARTDLAKFVAALRTCRNFVILRQGGASVRAGTEFVSSAASAGVASRLMKFVFSHTQAIVLEFGNSVIRFYVDGARIAYTLASPYSAAEAMNLGFAQSGDVITLVHPDYTPRELRRITNTNWTLTEIDFAMQYGPNNVLVSGGLADAAKLYYYTATFIDATTGAESHIGATGGVAILTAFKPTDAAPVTVSWDPAATAAEYNVYRQEAFTDGVWAYIGRSSSTQFLDTGLPGDTLSNPPEERLPFAATDDYPSVVGYYQQRLILANTNNDPRGVWASRTGDLHNFRISSPLEDSDAVTFSMVSAEIEPIRYLLDMGRLLIGTEGAQFLVSGDANGVLTPAGVNPRLGSTVGANHLKPIRAPDSLLYVGPLGTAVRESLVDLGAQGVQFSDADLTVLASHLFDGHTIVDWDYQDVPAKTVWAVRDDGVLLGLTYIRDQELLAWHRHDTDGTFERVCVIPEGSEHRVYVLVRRVVNGAEVRYIERFRSPILADLEVDAAVMDSSLEYDGRDAGAAGAITQRLTGGTEWDATETLTLTASGSYFSSGDVGNGIFLHGVDGTLIRFTIIGYTSPTVVTGRANKDVPVAMQDVAIVEWDHAVDAVTGLSHLAEKDVAVFADGLVVASPNNPAYTVRTVDADTVTLDRPYAHIRVGLPFLADLETLDIDTPGGASIKESKIAITRVGLQLAASRGLFVGGAEPTGDDATENLDELIVRTTEALDEPVTPFTGFQAVTVRGEWNSHGRIFIRQVDPVPATVLAAMPIGYVP